MLFALFGRLGCCCAITLAAVLVVRLRPAFGPRTPEAIIRDHRTRKERIWLSSRQRGFARRSLNSLTLMPVSKRKIPLTFERGKLSLWSSQKLKSLSSKLHPRKNSCGQSLENDSPYRTARWNNGDQPIESTPTLRVHITYKCTGYIRISTRH